MGKMDRRDLDVLTELEIWTSKRSFYEYKIQLYICSLEPLKKFKALADKDVEDTGILVCRVEKNTPMPSDTLAIPWTEFPKWLKDKLKTQPPEVRNY
jgi:hypothetical protein